MIRSMLTLLALVVLLQSSPALSAQTFADLKGKWTLKKKSDRWKADVTQALEFKDDKFFYKVTSKTGELLLMASGNVTLEKVGRFQVMKLTAIKGGYTESDQEETNDDRHIIYSKGWKTLKLALNFDQERDDEEVEMDSYTKSEN